MSLRFVGSFEILKRIDQVAYRLALPPTLSAVHNVFHVLTPHNYVSNVTHVLSYEDLELQADLSYEEQLV